MGSTFFGLSIGYKSLQAQQRALDVTSHNIANANTQGYTRQDVIMEPSPPIHVLQGYLGTGVDVTEFRRIRDQFLDIQLRTENKALGEWETKSNIMGKLEVIFNEPSDSSLRSVMDEYWESWQRLSKNPESVAIRASVMQSGVTLADTFNHMARQFVDLQADINKGIGIKVNEVNSLASQVRDLNVQVIKAEAGGLTANDLRDRRDYLVEQLSKIVDINVVEDNLGSYSVTLGGKSLVSRAYLTEIKFTENTLNPTAATMEWLDPLTGATQGPVKVAGGQLNGYLQMRDDLVPKLVNDVSQLANRIAREVNDLHKQGYALDGSQGLDFFVRYDDSRPVSADNIRVNQALVDNVNLLAAGVTNPVRTGDGSIALKLAELKNTSMINPGQLRLPAAITGSVLTGPISLTAGSGASITGAVDLSTGFDFTSLGSNNSLIMNINGVQRTITLTGNQSAANLATYIQDTINNAYSPGAVNVSLSGGHLMIQDNLQKNADSQVTVIGGGAASALFGANWATTDITTTAGQAANNYMTLTVNGETKRVDLATGNLAPAAIVADLQTKLDTAFGGGQITAALSGSQIVLTSQGTSPYKGVGNISGPAAEALGLATDYTATADDFYRSTLAQLGTKSLEAERMTDNQTLLTQQLENKRDSISGVSLDEEMTNMIRFQHAYSAAARVINAMDEMLEVIVNRLGLVGR